MASLGPTGPSESQRQAAVNKVVPRSREAIQTERPSFATRNQAFGPSPSSVGRSEARARSHTKFQMERKYSRPTPFVGIRANRPVYRGTRVGLSGGVEYSKGSLTREPNPYTEKSERRGETRV